jgi:hypothetical protein
MAALREELGMSTINWPKHDASLHLTHNDHKSVYETVQEYRETREVEDHEWASAEQRDKAYATGELWELQWYPDTPVGFYVLYAADFDALMDAVEKRNWS